MLQLALPAFEDFLILNYFCHFEEAVLVDAVEGVNIYMAALFFDIYPEINKKKNIVKILKIGAPEIITIIVLHLEQLDFTVQYCVQKMQTE